MSGNGSSSLSGMSALLDGDELVERVFHVDRGIWVHDMAPDDLCDIIRVRRRGLKEEFSSRTIDRVALAVVMRNESSESGLMKQ